MIIESRKRLSFPTHSCRCCWKEFNTTVCCLLLLLLLFVAVAVLVVVVVAVVAVVIVVVVGVVDIALCLKFETKIKFLTRQIIIDSNVVGNDLVKINNALTSFK